MLGGMFLCLTFCLSDFSIMDNLQFVKVRLLLGGCIIIHPGIIPWFVTGTPKFGLQSTLWQKKVETYKDRLIMSILETRNTDISC